MTHQHAAVGDTLYFGVALNDASLDGTDGTSPAFDVRLAGAAAGAAPVLSGTPSLLSHADYPPGAYEIAVVATSGNGFAADSTYSVFANITVGAVTPTFFVGSFTLNGIPSHPTQAGRADVALQVLSTAGGPWYTPAQGLSDIDILSGSFEGDIELQAWEITANLVGGQSATAFEWHVLGAVNGDGTYTKEAGKTGISNLMVGWLDFSGVTSVTGNIRLRLTDENGGVFDATCLEPLVDTGEGFYIRDDGGLSEICGTNVGPNTWKSILDGSVTAEQIMRALLARAAGDRLGGGTSLLKWFRPDGVTAAITFTSVDENGNTSTITLDLD